MHVLRTFRESLFHLRDAQRQLHAVVECTL